MVDRLHHNPLSRKGFNLIEAAIVLGVVGLVIGGIWVGAATVSENYKVNKTASDLELIVKNAQNLISFRDAEAIGNIEITSMLRDAGVFPKDFINGNLVKSQFGGNVRANLLDGSRIDFSFDKIKSSSCSRLIVKISSIGALAGSRGNGSGSRPTLGYVIVSNSSSPYFITTDFPISPEIATSACGNTTATTTFTYGLTRTN